MAERQGGSSTQIMVAIIGVSGVVGAALIANWDKIFRENAPGIAAAAPPASGPAAAASVPIEAARDLGASQAKALQASAGALDQITAQIETAGVAAITGWWRDGEGYTYRIEQQGSAFTFGQFQSATMVGRGGGQIAGRTLNYGFESADGSRGKCTAEVAADGETIAGRCGTGGPTWPFAISKVDGAKL